MSKYQVYKEKARQEAIDWQNSFGDNNYSYGELVEWQSYFENKARKYGLMQEFKENGII